jgi:hypothetical protein
MPVLLRSLAEVFTASSEDWDWFHRPRPRRADGQAYEESDAEKAHTLELKRLRGTAYKLVPLAQHVTAYASSISPAHASTAQLVQLDQALDAFAPALTELAWAMENKLGNTEFDFKLIRAIDKASTDLPKREDRQVFRLLAERLTNQQQPAAELMLAVAAGLAARCSSSSSRVQQQQRGVCSCVGLDRCSDA